jgi:quercetin dioxygenase-like cupin family protein
VSYVLAMKKRLLSGLLAASTVAFGAMLCAAQPAPTTRKELQRAALAAAPGRDAVSVLAEIPVGAASARHSHPGDDLGYVLEGTIVLQVDGQPPLTLHAGDAFTTPPGRVHNARNIGTVTARALDIYIIEKGKPAVIVP